MRIRWIGVALVLLAVAGVLVVKQRAHRLLQAPVRDLERPSVLLVADLREADEPGDRCAEIIHAVREANKRGVRVQELMPDSSSDLLRHYRVLTAPTVLVLSEDGRELGRFEGESQETVNAVRTRLATLVGSSK
jgi:hypothetical protein